MVGWMVEYWAVPWADRLAASMADQRVVRKVG